MDALVIIHDTRLSDVLFPSYSWAIPTGGLPLGNGQRDFYEIHIWGAILVSEQFATFLCITALL